MSAADMSGARDVDSCLDVLEIVLNGSADMRAENERLRAEVEELSRRLAAWAIPS